MKKPRRLGKPVGLIVISLVVIVFGIVYFNKSGANETRQAEVTTLKVSPLKNANLSWPSVGHAGLGTTKDGVLALSSSDQKPRPTASMAKLILALTVMEKQPLKIGQGGPSYKINSEDVANYNAHVAKDGSVLLVYEGMLLTKYEALQALLLPSANNIADLLAKRVFGSTSAYRSYANEMLKGIGAKQTVVADASGLSSATVSTPSDLVIIGIAALQNPVIAEIVAQQEARIPGYGMIANTNKLLGEDGIIGLKTGTTSEAGSCLLFAGRFRSRGGEDVTIVGVITGGKSSETLFSDSRKLLESAKQGFGGEI